MNQRDRLIELLDRFHWRNGDTDEESTVSMCFVDWECEKIADYLIQNGVIAMPCEVGDTIYQIYDNEIEEFIATEIRQFMSGEFKIVGECNIHGYGFYNHKKCSEDFCGRNSCNTIFPSYEIGKTVFLTKEEAEKALKERKDKK